MNNLTHILVQLSSKFLWIGIMLLLAVNSIQAQEVQTTVDAPSVKIGEEVQYIVNVTVDTTSVVIFPEVNIMGRMEVIESYKVDTSFAKAKMKLIKKYGITQFDSGVYSIPQQKLLINGKGVFTDSLEVRINNVLVDTTKQKLYDIKPIIEVEKPKKPLNLLLILIILGLIIVGLVIYFIFFRKTKKEKEEKIKLPPFEEALENLKVLENSSLLEKDEYKKYYSQLTDVLKGYFEEEVYDNALENTSDEIITKLELLRDSGELPISLEIITELRKVLQTADLVKFAKSKPDAGTARVDRSTIENVINETKQALPEPTEEELLRNEQYRLEQEKKKKKRKIIYASLSFFGALLITSGVYIYMTGFTEVKDNVIGHPTKKLLEGTWITSEYGTPAIVVTTPKVLKRMDVQNPNAPEEHFAHGSLNGGQFYIEVGVVRLKTNPIETLTEEESDEEEEVQKIDLELVNENTLKSLESKGATNLLVKQERYENVSGFEGMKAFGSFNIATEKGKMIKNRYEIVTFSQKKAIQQIIVVYQEDDRYAEEIVKKILESVELKKVEE
ncbi:MAG: hypothetical protein HRT68_08045 [Flavobacteriaceae bacterium]|nr:hypothetical protein [Flavobacteriaceae bacterium]